MMVFSKGQDTSYICIYVKLNCSIAHSVLVLVQVCEKLVVACIGSLFSLRECSS